MPRKPNYQSITCEFFVWRLYGRGGVFYADGRGRERDLGRHSLGTRDKAEALARLKQLDLAKAIELGVAAAPTGSVTTDVSIDDGWSRYIEFCGRSQIMGGVSSGTLKRYRAARDKHVKFCQKHGIGSWEAFDGAKLERYGNWLAAHRADRTAYMEITLLKSVNRWLIEQKLLPGDAKLSMSLHKPTGTDTYCYSRDEVAAMIQHCKRKRRLGWLGHVIVALSHTGLRISELAGLRWTDLNLAKNMLRVADERGCARKVRAGTARTTKGRRSRAIPIHPHLKQVLVGLKHSSDGYVFHAQQGGRLHSRNVLEAFISKVIEPLKKRFPTAEGDIGFEHGRLHSFRHFFCSQAFLGGASEGEIREWLGHKESAMVEHYRHLRGEDAQRKMAQIEFVDRRDEQRGDVA